MKNKLFVLTLILASSVVIAGQGTKQANEIGNEIRGLEQSEADAVLRQDFAALEKTWHEEFTVNAPNNQVVKGRAEVLKIFRAGAATYSSFVREIESLRIHKDTVIVMGLETVKPIGNAPLAGQTVRRRYTNIWIRKNGKWLLAARQATNIFPG